MFEAGRLAGHRGWQSAEVVETDALGSVSPGAGELVVVAPEGTFSVPQAREVAALHSSGKNVVVVSAVPLSDEAMAWMPEGCTHVLGEPLGPRWSVSEASAAHEVLEDASEIEMDAGPEGVGTGGRNSPESESYSRSFETKADILADLLVRTINAIEWDQFKRANDLGLSLAVAHRGSLATLHESGKSYVEQSYRSLLEVLGLEGEFADLSEVFEAATAGG